MGKGTIVDATIINAPSSTKNAEKKRDPQMHQTRKGKQWYFGMKVHTGTDTDSGLVHTVRATSANVADVNVLGELLHGARGELCTAIRPTTPRRSRSRPKRRYCIQRQPTRHPQPSAHASSARAQPASVASSRHGGASLPGGQAPVGPCEGALPRDQEELGPDERAVRSRQSVPYSIPIDEFVG